MTLLYPSLLWLLIPVAILAYSSHGLRERTHLLILALLTLSLARPAVQQGAGEKAILSRNIVIAFDISYSMRAADIAPTRYEYARETIRSLLDISPADHISLIAFTTNPLLLSPATTDHRLIKQALESIEPHNILTKGTSIGALLRKVVSAAPPHATLVLITDGGEESDAARAAAQLKGSGISLVILPLATTVGTSIRDEDGKMLKDESGNIIISRLNPMLSHLASLTRAIVVSPSSPQESARQIYTAIESQGEGELLSKQSRNTVELYIVPLFIAMALFLLLHTRAVRYLIIALAFAGVEANASMWDTLTLSRGLSAYEAGDYNRSLTLTQKIEHPTLQSAMLTAATYYRLGAYEEAIAVYEQIRSTSEETKHDIYHNLGNCYAKINSYKKAREYYTRALALRYDEETLHNLSLIAHKSDALAPSLSTPPSGDTDKNTASKEGEEDKSDKSGGNSESGGSSGATPKKKKDKKEEKTALKESSAPQKQPLSSKVYDLINEGYIYEKKPW